MLNISVFCGMLCLLAGIGIFGTAVAAVVRRHSQWGVISFAAVCFVFMDAVWAVAFFSTPNGSYGRFLLSTVMLVLGLTLLIVNVKVMRQFLRVILTNETIPDRRATPVPVLDSQNSVS